MFPRPDLPIFDVAGRAVNANDVLPITHTIAASDETLNRGAALGHLVYELAAIGVLSVLFFAAGTVWFTRRHMSANAA